MADPKVPGTAATPTPEAPATEKPEVPSFSSVVAERTAARQEEIASSAGKPATEPKPSAGEPPAEAELSDEEYAKLWDGQPENFRKAVVKRAYQSYNDAISAEYGDILPTIVAAKENPALREILVELGDSTKKELLSYITDPELRKHAKDLTTPELRDFLLGEALTTYNKYAQPAPGRRDPDAPSPAEARLTALEEKYENEALGRENSTYVNTRGQEVRAVNAAYSHLTPDQIAHVVTFTENRFETMAARAGIDTKKDDWAARAIRAGLKPPQYREYAAQYAEILGKSKPPAAPATTPTGKGGEAAPRDASEADRKKAGVTALAEFKAKSPAFNRPATRR
jgi:hypothetical protein